MKKIIDLISSKIKKFLIYLIRIYKKYLSAGTQPRCRYYPTCSNYAIEAIEVHGIFYGVYLATIRVLKCNPFFKGGIDMVPEKKKKG